MFPAFRQGISQGGAAGPGAPSGRPDGPWRGPAPGDVRSPHWEPTRDGVESIDFTLPGDVTDYLLCVSLDGDGPVIGIEMES